MTDKTLPFKVLKNECAEMLGFKIYSQMIIDCGHYVFAVNSTPATKSEVDDSLIPSRVILDIKKKQGELEYLPEIKSRYMMVESNPPIWMPYEVYPDLKLSVVTNGNKEKFFELYEIAVATSVLIQTNFLNPLKDKLCKDIKNN